jgi:hypothetical protein
MRRDRILAQPLSEQIDGLGEMTAGLGRIRVGPQESDQLLPTPTVVPGRTKESQQRQSPGLNGAPLDRTGRSRECHSAEETESVHTYLHDSYGTGDKGETGGLSPVSNLDSNGASFNKLRWRGTVSALVSAKPGKWGRELVDGSCECGAPSTTTQDRHDKGAP